jgi:hypothetical protein
MNFENLFYQSTKVPNFGTLKKKKKKKKNLFHTIIFRPPILDLRCFSKLELNKKWPYEMLFKIEVEQKRHIYFPFIMNPIVDPEKLSTTIYE